VKSKTHALVAGIDWRESWGKRFATGKESSAARASAACRSAGSGGVIGPSFNVADCHTALHQRNIIDQLLRRANIALDLLHCTVTIARLD
jgi:hypothetical protein